MIRASLQKEIIKKCLVWPRSAPPPRDPHEYLIILRKRRALNFRRPQRIDHTPWAPENQSNLGFSEALGSQEAHLGCASTAMASLGSHEGLGSHEALESNEALGSPEGKEP